MYLGVDLLYFMKKAQDQMPSTATKEWEDYEARERERERSHVGLSFFKSTSIGTSYN